MISFFCIAYFTKKELFWGLSLVISGILMIASYNVQIIMSSGLVAASFPYLMGLNLLFFALSLFVGLFDIFDKYSISILSGLKK